ncbi:MAG: ABC transporter permease [Pseudomonadota bacterium]
MNLLLGIAWRHLLDRKRQSFISILGIILGVAFFLGIASLMIGSEKDFIARLVDNSPHITIQDEYRSARQQPLVKIFKEGAVQLKHVKALNEPRGIRNYEIVLKNLRAHDNVRASPTLTQQALVTNGGQDRGITLQGIVPEDAHDVMTIEEHMVDGSIQDLEANRDGIIIGATLAEKLTLSRGNMLTVAATTGDVRNFKIVGIFRTGQAAYDEAQAFIDLKRAQALFNRANRANRIIIKLDNPYDARAFAAETEHSIGYKSVSWQEATEDLMSVLTIRNIIMYTVVSAVLVVAAFGIYNVISTVVTEKQRDIAILKSMGFETGDIKKIFLYQGAILGIGGCLIGVPLGAAMMFGLSQVQMKPPGVSDPIQLPIDWGITQFIIAALFALVAAMLAAYLPARKAAHVQPVEILRGGF